MPVLGLLLLVTLVKHFHVLRAVNVRPSKTMVAMYVQKPNWSVEDVNKKKNSKQLKLEDKSTREY